MSHKSDQGRVPANVSLAELVFNLALWGDSVKGEGAAVKREVWGWVIQLIHGGWIRSHTLITDWRHGWMGKQVCSSTVERAAEKRNKLICHTLSSTCMNPSHQVSVCKWRWWFTLMCGLVSVFVLSHASFSSFYLIIKNMLRVWGKTSEEIFSRQSVWEVRHKSSFSLGEVLFISVIQIAGRGLMDCCQSI